MTDPDRHWSEMDSHGNEVSLDVTFDLLRSRRRRYILRYLTHHSDTIELQELADQLVACEETPLDDRERLVTSLYHVHLPKLADSGVVTFYPEQRLVEPEATADALLPYLALAANDDVQTDEFSPGCESGVG
ncbi:MULTISPECIES: DUF7344 domain-containing protein [Haloferax]|nr:hypothetical protein [Haloferax mediterranei]